LEQDRDDIQIVLSDNPSGRKLILPDVLFGTSSEHWLAMDSLPEQPLEIFDVSKTPIDAAVVLPSIPVIYGRRGTDNEFLAKDRSSLYMGLDIFGSAFFMLTRYEELVLKERDKHIRFPAIMSLAFKEGFLQRPIINEYLEILWWALRWLDPKLKRKTREYSIDLSHDVDWPITDSQGVKRAVKSAVGDIVRRKEPGLALKRLNALARSKSNKFDYDVNNTFDCIMETSEAKNLTGTFNIIACNTAGRIDGNYTLEDAWMRKLLAYIYQRGHAIGLHLSYNSYCDKGQTLYEYKRLVNECKKLSINQHIWGARQHYLRFENPVTWQNMNDAGVNYDSTLAYADQVGFRCGVCYEYPVFNLLTRTALSLYERPLIVMEVTLYDYMKLSHEKAKELIMELDNKCKLYNGKFTLLWHNSSLITKQSRYWYKRIVNEIASSKEWPRSIHNGAGNNQENSVIYEESFTRQGGDYNERKYLQTKL
jgi:hypothetical protein